MRFASVLAVGAAAIDRIATTDAQPARLATSNPGRVRAFPGGAARNVAEALARLGVPVCLIAMVGMDGDGDLVIEATRRAGVDVAAVLRDPAQATACYLAVHDAGGDIVLGVADMDAAQAMPEAHLRRMLTQAPDALVFAEANLGPAALTLLAGSGRQIAACAISVEKAPRLRPLFGRLEALFLNRYEAATLAGQPADDPAALAAFLRSHCAPHGVLGLGAEGALVWSPGRTARFPALAARVVSTNGAGDTLAAATLAGWRMGMDFIDAAEAGLRAAALTVASPWAVAPDLTVATILPRSGRPPAAAGRVPGDPA